MKLWNVYSIERRKGRAVAEVSAKAGVELQVRPAAGDTWRRPPA